MLLLAACRHAPVQRPEMLASCDVPPPPLPPAERRTTERLTPEERDSLVRDVQARRAAWRARGITAYRLRVAAGCFCPWPQTPAILDVQRGAIVALRDTLGKRMGAVREPWSTYTVEGLFDAVEVSLKREDIVSVRYDACFGYPTSIRGNAKGMYPDAWFWVTADHLTPRR